MTKKSSSWSFTRILLLTIGVGVLAGAVLGSIDTGDPRSPEQIAEDEVARLLPTGAPVTPVDSMEPDPVSMRGIPPYPGVYPRRLIRRGRAEGAMSVAWFSTPDSTQQVMDHYRKAFHEDGRDTVTERMEGDMGYVAWLERVDDAGVAGGVLHMISVMRQFSQTVVFVSASRPDLELQRSYTLPDGLKLPPTATAPQVVDTGEIPLANQVVYSRAANTSPAQVATFFESQFKEQGYTVTESVNSAAQSSVTGQKNGVVVVVAARVEGPHSSVLLTYEKQPQENKP